MKEVTVPQLRIGFWRNAAGTVLSLLICLVGVRFDTFIATVGGFCVGIGVGSMHLGLKELRKRGEPLWPDLNDKEMEDEQVTAAM